MARWSAKREAQDSIGESGVPESAAGEEAGQLTELTQRLAQLGYLLDQTNEQVVAYLIHRESQAGACDGGTAALAERIDALGERLDRLAGRGPSGDAPAGQPDAGALDEETLAAVLRPLQEKLDQIGASLQSVGPGGGPAPDTLGPALAQIRDGVNQQVGALAEGIHQLQQRLDAGIQHLAGLLQPEEPEEPDALPAASSDWQRVILGPELAERPGLDFQRQQLLEGLFQGDQAACSFVGQMLVFRSAMSEKLPPLLKEIGEAYYRWQPKTQPGSNPMEETLVAWLCETMQDAGIPNTIELVHPGERFDSARHNASTRGVEVTEVHGWVVLRDNGRVYTKASVTVK